MSNPSEEMNYLYFIFFPHCLSLVYSTLVHKLKLRNLKVSSREKGLTRCRIQISLIPKPMLLTILNHLV